MRKILPFAAILVLVVAGAVAYWGVSKRPSGDGAPEAGQTAAADGSMSQAQAALPVLAVQPDDMVLGSPDAKVTIVEYASLTCPHCAHFETETLPQLQKAYIDTGKVKLVYRDFPLDGLALKAAMVAHCAGSEKYFAFLNLLFENQDSWAHIEDPVAGLATIAKIGGMGEEQLRKCLNDEALSQRVAKSRFDAEKSLDITSTPTFFINGEKVPGALPFEQFEAILKPLVSAP
ncbi:MAG: DsbA family protein [Alphaproteobacteria bacterium]